MFIIINIYNIYIYIFKDVSIIILYIYSLLGDNILIYVESPLLGPQLNSFSMFINQDLFIYCLNFMALDEITKNLSPNRKIKTRCIICLFVLFCFFFFFTKAISIMYIRSMRTYWELIVQFVRRHLVTRNLNSTFTPTIGGLLVSLCLTPDFDIF